MATATASPTATPERLSAHNLIRRGRYREFLAALPDEAKRRLQYRWDFWARDNQLPPPGDWRTWALVAGRGFGKTRTGAEWVRGQVETGRCVRMALVAPTASDARDVMVEGESGLLAICPPWDYPSYEPSKRRLTWPNGAQATLYSADEPERLRGPQHDGGWLDELGSWVRPQALDMFLFGNRLRDRFGQGPRTCITTTPKPLPHVKAVLKRKGTVVTRGSTYENRENLAAEFLDDIRLYEGTRLGRQEIHAELLEDTPGALWVQDTVDAHRIWTDPPGVTLVRVVVALDPAATSAEGSAETGIVAAGKGSDGRGYVLEDCSVRGTPEQWARAAVACYDRWRADLVVGEANNGGDMIEAVLRTLRPNLPYRKVVASRGKQTRAEPIAALYTQGKVSHCGLFNDLESQMTTWVPGLPSPDRMDALVWCLTELMVGSSEAVFVSGGRRRTLAEAGFSPGWRG
jgi:phage terminase large subunit-like protein